MAKYVINPNKKLSKINKEIYGHFSEHLGRCIYEGIYVGEDSKIPNRNGMRVDNLDQVHVPDPVKQELDHMNRIIEALERDLSKKVEDVYEDF